MRWMPLNGVSELCAESSRAAIVSGDEEKMLKLVEIIKKLHTLSSKNVHRLANECNEFRKLNENSYFGNIHELVIAEHRYSCFVGF